MVKVTTMFIPISAYGTNSQNFILFTLKINEGWIVYEVILDSQIHVNFSYIKQNWCVIWGACRMIVFWIYQHKLVEWFKKKKFG